MANLVQILTVPAVRRRVAHQLSVAGIAIGAASLALVTWLAVRY